MSITTEERRFVGKAATDPLKRLNKLCGNISDLWEPNSKDAPEFIRRQRLDNHLRPQRVEEFPALRGRCRARTSNQCARSKELEACCGIYDFTTPGDKEPAGLKQRNQHGKHIHWRNVDVLHEDPQPTAHGLCEHARLPAELARGLCGHIRPQQCLGVCLVAQVNPHQTSVPCVPCKRCQVLH